jgi:hypothetical protein
MFEVTPKPSFSTYRLTLKAKTRSRASTAVGQAGSSYSTSTRPPTISDVDRASRPRSSQFEILIGEGEVAAARCFDGYVARWARLPVYHPDKTKVGGTDNG